MPTLSVGRANRPANKSRRGVTLIELLVVVTLIALLAGLTYPSINSSLDSLRLRSASDSILALIDTAVDRTERRQQAIEMVISPKENSITLRSADMGFTRRVELHDGIRILGVTPALTMPNAPPDANRQFLIYPGGTVPAIGIEIATASGHRRTIAVDPITGRALSEIPK
jgi:prepilin-type N-terminal cleavage/methylation domain-containing protein